MISTYKQLTGRYLKASKKRTALTILGIVLSVALISTIGLFFNSMQVAQVEQAKNNYGAFHLAFTKVNDDLASKITNNPKVLRYGFFSSGEEIDISGKLTISELTATDKAFELMPYRVKEGRLPEKEDETAVEKWVLGYIDKEAKVGDNVRFNNKSYRLTGILENSMQNQIENKGILLTRNNSIDKTKAALVVELSTKTSLRKGIDELKALASEETVKENRYLLTMLGVGEASTMWGFYITLSIIIGIVIISTIAVIYNSFQISVVERIKQFGLLRAIGTTPKQIRRLVFREATVLALIGIPAGLLLGIIAMYLINLAFKLIGADSVFTMKTVISPTILAISAAVGLISIYLSAALPAHFAGKISPLVAISSRSSITKEKIKRRKNRLAQKVFGFEGALASKNIKRSRKRYRITVFSIVISVMLFITFKSFMDMSLTITSTPNESNDMHFSIIRDIQATEENLKIEENMVEDLKKLSTVDMVYRIYDTLYFNAAISKNKEVKDVQDIGGIYNEVDGKTTLFSSIVVYDKEALEEAKKYLLAGEIDIEKLNKKTGVILINKNRIINGQTKKTYMGPAADMKVGDEIELQYFDHSSKEAENPEFGKGKVKKARIMAILENDPFNYRGTQSGLKIISTAEVAQSLAEVKDVKPINLNIKIKDVKSEETALTQIESVINVNPSLSVINNIDNNRKDKTSMLMVQILIYGFVIVVSLIGSVNIINTLTTNIILRKREFAALKAIGLTQRGLKKMITYEGLLYGIIGSIYGSIIGCITAFLLYQGLGGIREFPWRIPWGAMAIAGVSAIVIGYLSVLAPLSRIKKENLIEAIREE
jgi:putative ABC transport system permease protein